MLKMIAQRESEQSEGVDANTIRRFLSALAMEARRNSDWETTFTPSEMDDIFYKVSGYHVTEGERNTLLRLPGLGVAPEKPANRIFVDYDFMHACSGFYLYEYILNPYSSEYEVGEVQDVSSEMSDIGREMVCEMLTQSSTERGVVFSAFNLAQQRVKHQMSFDIFCVGLMNGFVLKNSTFSGISIRELDLCDEIYDGISIDFDNCIIERLNYPSMDSLSSNLKFKRCLIGTIEGLVSDEDLPDSQFDCCDVDQYTNEYSVNNDVLATSLPLGVRVLVVTLRKIYTQSGSARLESALVRGLDHRAKMLAQDVIASLQKHKLVLDASRQGKVAYSGNKILRKEALSIIQSPNKSNHVIVSECAAL
ncbi:MAG: hypothetical protein LCH47_14940 [Proteobacteria bacterium]|nr:hypothetical protein [Pseudomonadota bacterium]